MSMLSAVKTALGLLSPDQQPATGGVPDPSMLAALHEFKKQRSNDLAKIIEKSSRTGAELAVLQEELQDWRDYARRLEKVCLAAGLDLPAAPDE